MANRYTDEQKAAMAQSLIENDWNIKRTAAEHSVSTATIWALKQQFLGVSETIKAKHEGIWSKASEASAKRIAELVPTCLDLNAVANAARIAVQGHLDYRDGRKGSAINVHNGDVNQTLVIEYAEDWRG